MNEPVLPDDLSRWPSDPHELLGVERGVAPKDVKRIYTRLIKVWKPEHHPEHFRRIREAYEAVLRYIEFFGRFEVIATPEEAPPTAEPIAAPKSSEPKNPIPLDEPFVDAPASNIVDPLTFDPVVDSPARIVDGGEPVVDPPAERIVNRPEAPPRNDPSYYWERAIRGEEAEAYRGLKLLYRERPQQTAIALRLYWLLSLDPTFDAEIKPREWLIAGLCNTGLQGACMELYRREIDAEPDEAFSDHFEHLLNLEAPTPALAEILSWRWMAARRTKRWATLKRDLQRERDRIARIDESAWFRLLLIACDGVAWIRDDENFADLWDTLQQELQHLQHLATRHGEWFDRLEFLNGVRRDWQLLRKSTFVSKSFLELIADAWHSPFHTFHNALVEMLGKMIDNPRYWLKELDRIAEEGPHVLHAFAELLRQIEMRQEEPVPRPPDSVLRHLASTFASGLTYYSSEFRNQVVAFCFREAIDPAWIIEPFLNRDLDWLYPVDPNRFVQIINDWPVRYLCQAYRLFWSGG